LDLRKDYRKVHYFAGERSIPGLIKFIAPVNMWCIKLQGAMDYFLLQTYNKESASLLVIKIALLFRIL
jgi:hypothetical protein